MNIEVIDIDEFALSRIKEDIKALIEQHNHVWFKIGLKLIQARAEFPSDKLFGKWIKECNFRLDRTTLYLYRECVRFISDSQATDLVEHNSTRDHGSRVESLNDWNVVKQAISSIKQTPSLKDQILEDWRKGACLTRSSFRAKYVALAQPDVEEKEIPVEQMTVGERLNHKREELKMKEHGNAVYHKAKKLSEKDVAEARVAKDKANEAKLRYELLTQEFVTMLTMDQFVLIRNCLHPDKHPNCATDKSKLAEAFALFNRLEMLVNKKMPIEKMRKFGWEKESPYYRQKKV